MSTGEGLRTLSEAATPGPWGVGPREDCKCCRRIDGLPNNVGIGTADEVDAAFVVAAVNYLRALLAEPAPVADEGQAAGLVVHFEPPPQVIPVRVPCPRCGQR